MYQQKFSKNKVQRCAARIKFGDLLQQKNWGFLNTVNSSVVVNWPLWRACFSSLERVLMAVSVVERLKYLEWMYKLSVETNWVAAAER